MPLLTSADSARAETLFALNEANPFLPERVKLARPVATAERAECGADPAELLHVGVLHRSWIVPIGRVSSVFSVFSGSESP